MQNQTLPPAGWYPDPANATSERWWDGTTWTEQVRAKVSAPPPPPPPGPAMPPTLQGYPAPPPNRGGSYTMPTPGSHSFAAKPFEFADAMRRGATLWTFRGRASRSEFWWWVLGSSLAGIPVSIVSAILGAAGGILYVFFYIFVTLATVKISVRRYHDVGKGGGLFAGLSAGIVLGVVILTIGGLIAAVEEASGSRTMPPEATLLMLLGGLVAAASGIWNLVIHCQSGKPERNRFDD